MAVSSVHTGWRRDKANNRLDFYYNGTRIGHINASGLSSALTITAATGLTVTSGGATVTTGGLTVTAGSIKLGTPGSYATTQPGAGVTMGGSSLGGTAPSGAITTAGGVFASDTVVKKIIADGTVSNIET